MSISVPLNPFLARARVVPAARPTFSGGDKRVGGDEAALTVVSPTTPALAGSYGIVARPGGASFLAGVGKHHSVCRLQAVACGQTAADAAPKSTPPAFYTLPCLPAGNHRQHKSEDDHVRLSITLFSAAALILLAQLLTSCSGLTIETYRVTGGVGKVQQDFEEIQPSDGPAGQPATANSGELPTSSVSHSVGTIVVQGGDNTQAADKAVEVTPGGGPGK